MCAVYIPKTPKTMNESERRGRGYDNCRVEFDSRFRGSYTFGNDYVGPLHARPRTYLPVHLSTRPFPPPPQDGLPCTTSFTNHECYPPYDFTSFTNHECAPPLQVELMEVVDFFRTPEKFKASGARAPKGVLLVCGGGREGCFVTRGTLFQAQLYQDPEP